MSKKLLLADDSVVIQKLVGLSFANEAIEIVSTDNGDDAVSMARDLQPDVVLADVVMPGLSGYEVCEAIKQDPALAGTPVLLLTGTFEAFDDARASAVGANGQITKPFEAQALVERVNEVMAEAAAAPPAAVAPPEPPPTIEAEAASAPRRAAGNAAAATPLAAAPEPSDADETIVTSLGSTPESAELFGANDGRLAGDTATREASLDLTPQLDADERDRDFFGAPGEGAAEELDQTGGHLAIGASVPGSSPQELDENDDATIAVLPNEGLPPMAPPLAPPSPTSAASSDPFERPEVEEKPAERLPKARPVDLDAALDAVPTEGDPTILMATDDHNASTSPNLGAVADEEPRVGFEDLTVHVPSADIDQDRATAPSPDVIGDTGNQAAAPGDAEVADLDAALEDERPALQDFGTPPPRDPFGVSATSERDRTAVQELDTDDPLGLSPASVTGGSVDFAFDVSEQVAAEPPETDVNEDSFSSLMDISESAILGADDAPRPAAKAEPDPAAETIVAGYDVSSSDLATAPSAAEEAAEQAATADPIPEPERLLEVPELPDAYRAAALKTPADEAPAAPATRTPVQTPVQTPVMGSADLFDDLATGSPLDELPTVTADAADDLSFGSGEALDVDEDLLEADLSTDLSTEFGADLDGGDAAGAVDDSEDDDEPDFSRIEAEPAAIVVDEAPAVDEFAIGTPPSPAPEPRVADLSPMVEQRIQETLEKVAWEAFSDLSETIVKQVLGRVEQVAWEVIPEMAETLVREEIRKMKGEQD